MRHTETSLELTDPLGAQCARVFSFYLRNDGEAARLGAYALGRRALEERLSLLELVALVHATLLDALRSNDGTVDPQRITEAAGGFMLECFSPYEMAFRGATEANDALRRQTDLLEEKVRSIAHEIHDSSAQLLAALHCELHGAQASASPDQRPRFDRMKALLGRVEEDLRRFSHELRPTMLDDLGLLPTLRSLGESVFRRTGLEVSVHGSTGGRLPPSVEIALYRVVQEGLANVTRHARASHASVRVERSQNEIRCYVEDDGLGYDASRVRGPDAAGGLGLVGIRERLAPLQGLVTCENVNGGARLAAIIPLETTHVDTSTAG